MKIDKQKELFQEAGGDPTRPEALGMVLGALSAVEGIIEGNLRATQAVAPAPWVAEVRLVTARVKYALLMFIRKESGMLTDAEVETIMEPHPQRTTPFNITVEIKPRGD